MGQNKRYLQQILQRNLYHLDKLVHVFLLHHRKIDYKVPILAMETKLNMVHDHMDVVQLFHRCIVDNRKFHPNMFVDVIEFHVHNLLNIVPNLPIVTILDMVQNHMVQIQNLFLHTFVFLKGNNEFVAFLLVHMLKNRGSIHTIQTKFHKVPYYMVQFQQILQLHNLLLYNIGDVV